MEDNIKLADCRDAKNIGGGVGPIENVTINGNTYFKMVRKDRVGEWNCTTSCSDSRGDRIVTVDSLSKIVEKTDITVTFTGTLSNVYDQGTMVYGNTFTLDGYLTTNATSEITIQPTIVLTMNTTGAPPSTSSFVAETLTYRPQATLSSSKPYKINTTIQGSKSYTGGASILGKTLTDPSSTGDYNITYVCDVTFKTISKEKEKTYGADISNIVIGFNKTTKNTYASFTIKNLSTTSSISPGSKIKLVHKKDGLLAIEYEITLPSVISSNGGTYTYMGSPTLLTDTSQIDKYGASETYYDNDTNITINIVEWAQRGNGSITVNGTPQLPKVVSGKYIS